MDASYKIQRGIHVHLIQFFMCPEFWVHINDNPLFCFWGAVAHVTAPLLFVESKNKKHVFVKIKACATDFLENQKFSMDL